MHMQHGLNYIVLILSIKLKSKSTFKRLIYTVQEYTKNFQHALIRGKKFKYIAQALSKVMLFL